MHDSDPFLLAGRRFNSRLLVGTGKYKNLQQTKSAIEASGAEIITVAVRRVDFSPLPPPAGGDGGGNLQSVLPPDRYTYLPNSAGCYTAEEAVRTLRLARELGGWNLVKLEVIGDRDTLYPDEEETIKAAKLLVAEGFDVMAYTTDSFSVAQELEAAGCCAVMPLGSPIGSGQGIQRPQHIERIVQTLSVPVLVDAGIGTASDASLAMELGCAGVLLNSAIAGARDPIAMARAMKLAVEAGRASYLAGRMPRRATADASSPQTGMIGA